MHLREFQRLQCYLFVVLDKVYKRQTGQCSEKSTFEKDVKTTCGNSKF